jgi:hypothetical protein
MRRSASARVRAGFRFNDVARTPDGSGTVSAFISPGTYLVGIEEDTDDFYVLSHQHISSITVTPTTTAIVIDAREPGVGSVTVDLDEVGGPWNTHSLSPLPQDDFFAETVFPPSGTPVNLSAGTYDYVTVNLETLTSLYRFDYKFELFPGLVISNGSSASSTVGYLRRFLRHHRPPPESQ